MQAMATNSDVDQVPGKTENSGYAEERYRKHHGDRTSLSSSEYTAVIEGVLREYVCMGQCNMYIAAAKDPEIKQAIKTYLMDVCMPNFMSLKKILQDGGYDVPVSEQNDTKPDQVQDVQTNAIDDQMITVWQWFAVRGFMQLWNMGAINSQRTDMRDAFIQNFHRANRWHVACYDLAVSKGYLEKLPEISPTMTKMKQAGEKIKESLTT
jgi:hypothetical protein